AQHEPPLVDSWGSSQLSVGAVIDFQDDDWPFGIPPVGFTNMGSKTHLILNIDPNYPNFQSQIYELELHLDIEWWDEFNTSHQETVKLKVDYNPNAATVFKAKSFYTLEGAYKLKMTVADILLNGNSGANMPEAVKLDAEMLIDRIWDLDCSQPPVFASPTLVGTSPEAGSGRLNLHWQEMDGAESYDLEWTYVSSYDGIFYLNGEQSAANLNYNFRNNASRVNIKACNYLLDLVFPRGYLIFRLRGVGRSPIDPEQPIYTLWNTAESGTVASVAQDNKYHISTGHEDKLNWQLSTTFAEEGKRKSVISYFDGSLRNRQSVTQINSDLEDETSTEQSIVGERIYDYYGRPAVSVLPTPTGRKYLHYYDKFNLNSDGEVYDWTNLGDGGADCAAQGDEMFGNMSKLYGASLYYSEQNPDKEGAQAFVPKAFNYPYSQIQYTADNTGRVRRQGGIGKDHQLGTGHETQSWYGAPFQEELDRLFGTDVGYAERYKKEMIRDANGQLSISYSDAHGRVIATALTGESPEALQALPSNTGIQTFRLNLGGKNKFNTEGTALISQHQLLVSNQGKYELEYAVMPQNFEASLCNDGSICMDCVYDLTISIKDECGQEMVNNGPYVAQIGPFDQIDNVCDGATLFEITLDDKVSANLSIGAYTVSKKLAINQEALEAYVELKMEEDQCLETFTSFRDELLREFNSNSCYDHSNPCEFYCEDQIDRADFTSDQDYNQAIDACKQSCESEGINPCEGLRQILLNDMSPGGQYALFERAAGQIDFPDLLSILDINNQLNTHPNGGQSTWQNPFSSYLDAEGNPALVNGLAPEQLDLETFIENWQASWAESLLPYHPQFCLLAWCERNRQSRLFDRQLLEVENFHVAQQNNWISSDGVANPLDEDAYVDADGALLAEIQDFNGTGFSMWKVAVMTVYCDLPPGADANDANTCLSNLTQVLNGSDDDAVWLIFRALYMSAKTRIIQNTYPTYLSQNSCNIDFSQGPYENKENRWPSLSEIIDVDLNSDPDIALDQLDNWTDGQLDDHCQNLCEGYQHAWLADLESCAVIDVYDPANQALIDQLMNAFTEICKEGCDTENPLGASQLPNGQVSFLGDNSFEDAINRILGPTINVENCFANFDTPAPYGTTYSGASENFPSMDTCACTAILEADRLYHVNLNNDPNYVGSREDIFFQQNGVWEENLMGKAGDCKAAFEEGNNGSWIYGATWPAEAVSFLENLAIPITAEVACTPCVDCMEFDNLMKDFTDSRLHIYPNSLQLLENYMNAQLGFNLSGQQYLDFQENCQMTASPIELLVEQNFDTYEDGVDNDTWEGWTTTGNFEVQNQRLHFYLDSPFSGTTAELKFKDSQFSNNDIDWSAYDKLILNIETDNVQHNFPSSFSLSFSAGGQGVATSSTLASGQGNFQLEINNFTPSFNQTNFEVNLTLQPAAGVTEIYIDRITITGLKTGEKELCNEPLFLSLGTEIENDCFDQSLAVLLHNAEENYQEYLVSVREDFREEYIAKCLDTTQLQEEFFINFEENRYHYTLYYYDQG
ncbi:MAG: hypothetical protein AAF696_21170, partial [Bacteroidota bacterium]